MHVFHKTKQAFYFRASAVSLGFSWEENYLFLFRLVSQVLTFPPIPILTEGPFLVFMLNFISSKHVLEGSIALL